MDAPGSRDDITGLVLAGGRGSRMGGVDKGLQLLHGVPLAGHALQRLAPQVGPLLLNANRHLDRYAAFGVPLLSDDQPLDYAGPLAGIAAALRACRTPWLAVVPCDSPRFPADLVARLCAAAAKAGAPAAMASCDDDGAMRAQPAFCLLHGSLARPLAAALGAGTRKLGGWLREQHCAVASFDDAAAFANINHADELLRFEMSVSGHGKLPLR